MKQILYLFVFIIVNTLSFEFLINRQSSTLLGLLALAVLVASGYLFIYKPLKNIKL